VTALVLVDGVVATPQNAPVYETLSHRFEGPDGGKNREEFVQALFTPAATAELRARIMKTIKTPSDSTASGAMLAMADPAIWKEDVISVPALAIYADKSRLANLDLMKRVFPSIEYVEIPGTDHFLMMERPQEFNRLLMAFLDKLQ
jgi:pimeloyl-ACP methyl ester carboxylesterase